MASSSSGGNRGGEAEGEENMNPFKLFEITADMSFEDVRKKYLNLIQNCQADIEGVTADVVARLITAWSIINDYTDGGDEEKFSEVKKQYFAKSEKKEESQAPGSLDFRKHFKTLGISADMSYKEAHKIYLKQQRKCHQDKGGDKEISQMISQAWTTINEAADGDPQKYGELVKKYFGAESECPILCPEDIDLDKVLEDKKLSTELRSLFENISKSKIRFEDNFYSVYTEVFSKVQVLTNVGKEMESKQCQICDGATFNVFEDHSTAVYYPFYDFVIGKNVQVRWVNFAKYLGGLFGDEVVSTSRSPVVYPVYNQVENEEQLSLVKEYFAKKYSDLANILEDLSFLCEKGKRIPEILEDTSNQASEVETIFMTISHHDDICSGKCKDVFFALLPLLLKGKQDKFKRWGNLAVKIYDWGFPEWAMVFVKAAMHFGDENACVQLAEHLVRKGDLGRAHHCYSVIGSCDLNLIGHMLGKKKIGSKLAVMYLVKTNDFKSLRTYGEQYCALGGDRNEAARFLLPLIFRRLQNKNYTRGVELLGMLLPKSMVFRSVQELARELVEDPAFELYECEGIAAAVVTEVERVCGGSLLGKVPDIYVRELKDYLLLSKETDERLNALTALSGAFHILLGSDEMEKYEERISSIRQHLLAPLLAEAVLRKQFHLICILASCSGMKECVEKVLTENRVKWKPDNGDGVEIQRDLPTGQLYSSALYLLRAVYNYKRNQIFEMRQDLDMAYFCGVGHSKVGESIVALMGRCPGLHEKIMRNTGTWFQEFRYDIKNNSYYIDFTPNNLGLGSVLEKIGGEYSKLVVVEKKILMEDDPEKIGFLYLDLVSLAPELGSILCCYIQAITYFYKAMRSNDDVIKKYGFVQLIEKICEIISQVVGNACSSKVRFVLRGKLCCLFNAHSDLSQAIKSKIREVKRNPY